MCGIFGGIGNYNTGILRALALANVQRGRDSVGFFTHNRLYKNVGDSFTVLQSPSFNRWLIDVGQNKKTWFLCGHTRMATHGSITKKNAHPFRARNFTGVHNGVIDAPTEYEVDSEYFWELLAAFHGNYQKAWEDIVGYWGLAWTDKTYVYLQAYEQELHVVEHDGAYYFSSDGDHLEICTGESSDKVEAFVDGETWKFLPNGTIEELDPLVKSKSASSDYSLTNWRMSTNGGSRRHWDYDDDYVIRSGSTTSSNPGTTSSSTSTSLIVSDQEALEAEFERLIKEYE